MTSFNYSAPLQALALAFEQLYRTGGWPTTPTVLEFLDRPRRCASGGSPREGIELLPDSLRHVTPYAFGPANEDIYFRRTLKNLLAQIILSARRTPNGGPGQPLGEVVQNLKLLLAKCGGVAATWVGSAPVFAARDRTDPLPKSLLELVMDDIATVVSDPHFDPRDDSRIVELCHTLGGTPHAGLAALEARRSRGESTDHIWTQTSALRQPGLIAFRAFIARIQEADRVAVVWRCGTDSARL